jgi:hypothetical protein
MPFHVYVIRLRPEVMSVSRFAIENPKRRSDKPCLYVGSTAHPPEVRYAKHIAQNSRTGSKLVRTYHDGLHTRLTRIQPVFGTREQAELHERLLTERLRRRGFAVWSR